MGAQGLQLGAKQEHVSAPAIVEWFLSHAIARKRERVPFHVPHPKRKHAVYTSDRIFNTLLGDRCKYHLRIRVSPERVSEALELLA